MSEEQFENTDDLFIAFKQFSWEELGELDSTKLEYDIDPEHIAYIIHTSGSTGKPKGTMISDRALCTLSNTFKETFRLSDADRGAVFHNFAFDFTFNPPALRIVMRSLGLLMMRYWQTIR